MCGGHPNTPQSIFEKWTAENGLSGDKAEFNYPLIVRSHILLRIDMLDLDCGYSIMINFFLIVFQEASMHEILTKL